MEDAHSPAKLAAMQISSGGTAGFVEVCLMIPLDVMKTRLQLNPSSVSSQSSLVGLVKHMYATEGLLSFYKGLLPPLLAETPKRATKFFTFEQYKRLFNLEGVPQTLVLSVAGLFSGMTEALVVNPFEVVKVRQQANRGKYAVVPSTYTTAREIYKEHGFGLNGLNRGLTSTLARHGIFNMCYFGFYHSAKPFFTPAGKDHPGIPTRLCLGFLAGSLASTVNIPTDVAKSRIQASPTGSTKYRGCLQTIGLVYKEEGFLALYKGLLPKIMRLGPGGAVMFVVYEQTFDWMKRTF